MMTRSAAVAEIHNQVQRIPDDRLPELIVLLRRFGEDALAHPKDGLRQALREMATGETRPVSDLLRELEAIETEVEMEPTRGAA